MSGRAELGNQPTTFRRMRAARLHSIGGSLQVDEVAEPVAGDGEVVVDVAFASVNPLDVWITQGNVGAAGAHLPWTPGTEATGYHDGKPVLIRGAGLGVLRPGLYSQRVAVPAEAVHPLPDDRHLAEIAGLGVAGVTAWNAVHKLGQVGPADRVLVLGASGGVGAIAVQLAHAAGATVIGQTGSADKSDVILASGADSVIVSGADGLAAQLSEAPTVVLDALGGPYTAEVVNALAPRGRLIVYGTSAGEVVTFNMRTLYRKGVVVAGYSGLISGPGEEAEVFAGLLAQVSAGSLSVPVEVLALGEAASAHQRILERKVTGKLILDVRR